MLAEIRANQAKLDSCTAHRFDQTEYEKLPRLGMKLTCVRCSGTMRTIDIGYYIKGYEAHGGSANDIWPGYHGPDESGQTELPLDH